MYYADEFTNNSDNNPLSHIMNAVKLNATGMRWVSEFWDFDFKVKYRPGKISLDCDCLLRNPAEHKFSSYTEKTNWGNIKILTNSISNVENNFRNILKFKTWQRCDQNRL